MAFKTSLRPLSKLAEQLKIHLKIQVENQGPTQSDAVIALDPGVRTFMTGYDPSGQAVEWGKNDISRIYQLSHIYDKIQSKHDSIHGKVHK